MEESDSKLEPAWYRCFWPWFIVGLLGTWFVGGIATVVIAYTNRDSLVSDLWYERGEQINRRLESEKNAARRSIRAEILIDDATGEVHLDLAGEGVDTVRDLVLELSHPTRASSDRSISLARSDAGSFRGRLEAKLSGRWYAALAPRDFSPSGVEPASSSVDAASGSWRLSGTLRLPSSETLIMGASR